MRERYEGLIAGCGIAGPVAAMALQRVGISTTIFEAREEGGSEGGLFLTLTANAMNALRQLGLEELVLASGHKMAGMAFFNHRGRNIGRIDATGDRARYGADMVTLKRAALHRVLRDEARRRGIPVRYGAALETLEDDGARLRASFSSGLDAKGDFLLGSDGIHSRTRQLVFPNAPVPRYTGLLDFGGFSRCPSAPPAPAMRMVFGREAFFGYFEAGEGELFWFSNLGEPREPARGELQGLPQTARAERLLRAHRDDPPWITEIIRATRGDIGLHLLSELPSLERWSRGRVCLVGDAAHGMPPHAGQGAAMAIEDALVLARGFRGAASPEEAFARFEQERRPRVERIVKQAVRQGSNKAEKSALRRWFRDQLLPVFLRAGAKQMAWVYSHRIAWEPEHAAEEGSANGTSR